MLWKDVCVIEVPLPIRLVRLRGMRHAARCNDAHCMLQNAMHTAWWVLHVARCTAPVDARVLKGKPRVFRCSKANARMHAGARCSRGTQWYSRGTHVVLTGYSRGTQWYSGGATIDARRSRTAGRRKHRRLAPVNRRVEHHRHQLQAGTGNTPGRLAGYAAMRRRSSRTKSS